MYRFNYIQKLQQRKHSLGSWVFSTAFLALHWYPDDENGGDAFFCKREKKGKTLVVRARSVCIFGFCEFVYCARSCPRRPVVGVYAVDATTAAASSLLLARCFFHTWVQKLTNRMH